MAWSEAVPGFGGQSGTFSQCSPGPHSELVVWSTGKRVMWCVTPSSSCPNQFGDISVLQRPTQAALVTWSWWVKKRSWNVMFLKVDFQKCRLQKLWYKPMLLLSSYIGCVLPSAARDINTLSVCVSLGACEQIWEPSRAGAGLSAFSCFVQKHWKLRSLVSWSLFHPRCVLPCLPCLLPSC